MMNKYGEWNQKAMDESENQVEESMNTDAERNSVEWCCHRKIALSMGTDWSDSEKSSRFLEKKPEDS
jgi:hypothetical protein